MKKNRTNQSDPSDPFQRNFILMLEVAHAGEGHGDADLVAGGDDFVVADGTAGLDELKEKVKR